MLDARDRRQRFDALYAEHRGTLHAFMLGRTGDPELALDLLQEVFLRVWRGWGSLDALPPERWRYWLYALARNVVVDHYRSQAVRDRTQRTLEQSTPPEHVASAEAQMAEREQLHLVDDAIHRLPEDLRVVLALHVLGERTSTEIGEVLGKPAGTVRYQLSEARRRLAAELRAVDED